MISHPVVSQSNLLAKRFELLKSAPVIVVVGKNADFDKTIANDIVIWLESKGISASLKYDDEIDLSALNGSHIIVVGGPLSNSLAASACSLLSSWFEIVNDSIILFAAGFKFKGKGMGVVNMEKVLNVDCGGILVLIAGIDRNGTLAAAKAFMFSLSMWGEVAVVKAWRDSYKLISCYEALSPAEKEKQRKKEEGAGVVLVRVG